MSDTVKIVIEIPKEDYLAFSELSEKEKANELSYYERIIANGIPLDDVKAEIEQLPLVLYAGYDHIEKDSVMHILDNIGKEREVKPND